MMLRVAAALVLMFVLAMAGGCGIFRNRDIPYQDSSSQAALQVPDDLDRPVTDDTLRIPEPSSRDIRAGSADIVQGASAASTSAGSRLDADSLTIADTPASAWRRAGLALERMKDTVEVQERDEQGLRYRVEVTGTQPTQGVIRRLFRREEVTRETVEIQFEPVAEGTRIKAVGEGEKARALLRRLQERLG
jgi:uncharacterized lipoprotein